MQSVKGYHCVVEELFFKEKWKCSYYSNKDGYGVSAEASTPEEAVKEALEKLRKKGTK